MYFEKFLECIVSTAKRLTCLTVVYLLIPTSNHNLVVVIVMPVAVVYLLIPTSNHNFRSPLCVSTMLFISWFLHQTTTWWRYFRESSWLFISWFLHQTTTFNQNLDRYELLFISWFLHQTTTTPPLAHSCASCLSLDSYIKPQPIPVFRKIMLCCLSLDSYIKPQHNLKKLDYEDVVYLLIPTSNHN